MKMLYRCPVPSATKIGSLSDRNDDENQNVKKRIILRAKQQLCTCTTLFSTFL